MTVEARPVAWTFEYVVDRHDDGTPRRWSTMTISQRKPEMPEDSVRNLRALYYSPVYDPQVAHGDPTHDETKRVTLSVSYHADPGETKHHLWDVYTTKDVGPNERVHVGSLTRAAVAAWHEDAKWLDELIILKSKIPLDVLVQLENNDQETLLKLSEALRSMVEVNNDEPHPQTTEGTLSGLSGDARADQKPSDAQQSASGHEGEARSSSDQG